MAVPARAATVPGTGRAIIVRPGTLVNTAALSFGNLVPGAAAGTATVATNGALTTTGGVTPAGGTVSAAGFTGMTDSFPFFVLIDNPPATVTLTRIGGGASMTVNNLNISGGAGVRFIPVNTVFTFTVGGRLMVGANQMQGRYVGSFAITVTYF